jgi:hypothetical protein
MSALAPPLSLIGPGDGDGVRAFVRQHTSLRAGTVEALGAGMGSDAWLIDGDWVARFPISSPA